ncbi:MAG: cell division protein CrgA [Bowdeniella nasicola]|nr:cell division protein CrgA [Bowdeniella nasicola]
MPKSRKRKTARPGPRAPKPVSIEPSPSWWAPTMVTLMILGLIWVVITYLMAGRWPLPIGNYNLLIGIGLMLAGFLMTLRWR